MPEPLMEGYRELWGSVLMMALHDALGDNVGQEAARDRRNARAWFDNPGEDFARVCTFAGFDPVAVYQAWRSGRIKKPGLWLNRNPRQPGVSAPTVSEHEKGAVRRNHYSNGSEPRQHAPLASPVRGAQEAAE